MPEGETFSFDSPVNQEASLKHITKEVIGKIDTYRTINDRKVA
jgi:hypothetical protein